MSFADFDAARRERQRALEPIRFRLGGQEFTCVALPTLALVFDLAAAPEPAQMDGTPNLAGVAAIVRFIEALLADGRQRKRFAKVLNRRDDVIDAETIVELGEWLSEQYAGRPTLRSIGSPDGQPTDGASSSTSRFVPADPSTT